MPFTLAHPALVMPLGKSRYRLSLTALLAGSIAPDFEFYFQMREVENVGHHWYGIILFDFPAALLFCFLFHNLLRNLFVANLPAAYRNRFSRFVNYNWNKYAAKNKWTVLLSLIIGIVSHILWDGFTHHDGLFVKMLPALAGNTDIMYVNVPVYFLLQVIFSIAGMWIVLTAINNMPVKSCNEMNEQNKIYWPAFVILLSFILMVRLVLWPQYNSFWGVFLAVMGGICYSWIVVSVLLKNYLIKKMSL